LRQYNQPQKVSVIIPIYNIKPEFVEKCLDSVIRQTLEDIEILIVDDGSSNGILEKCLKFYNNDKRVSIITQKNQGVSTARNNGVSLSTGKWITFVDADDWIDINMLEILYKRGEDTNSEIVICNSFKEINAKSTQINIFPVDIELMNPNQKEELMLKTIISKHKTFSYNSEIVSAGATWAKLYNRKFWLENDLSYDKNLVRSQDSILNIYAFQIASKISFVSKSLYHYRYNELSAVNKYRKDALHSYELAISRFEEFANKFNKNKVYDEAIKIRKTIYFLHSITLDQFHKDNNLNLKYKIESIRVNREKNIFSDIFTNIDYSNYSFGVRVFLFLIKIKSYYIAYYIYKFTDYFRRYIRYKS